MARTQDLDNIFEVNSAAFIAYKSVYKRYRDRLDPKPLPIIIDKEKSLDIDNKKDFTLFKNILKKQMKFYKRKKLRNFPGFIIEKFLDKKFCDSIIFELNNFNNFDDLVMSGRNRINKGSNNFKKFLINSRSAKNLFNKFNKKNTFKNIENLLSRTDDSNRS